MTSGIQWDELLPWTDPKNDEPHLGYEADPIHYVLSKRIAAPPDTVWVYNGGGTDMLGNIIERVSENHWTPSRANFCSRHPRQCDHPVCEGKSMSLKLTVGDLTIHRIIE